MAVEMEPKWPQWDVTLRFWDPKTEALYWKHHSSELRIAQDRRAIIIVIIGALLFYWRANREGLIVVPSTHAEMILVLSLRLAILGWTLLWPKHYLSNRFFFVSFLRIHNLVYSARAFVNVHPTSPTVHSLVWHLLTKSTVMVMAVTPLGFQLSFRDHIFLQTIGIFVAVVWASDLYCRGPIGSGPVAQQFTPVLQSVGDTVEGVMRYATHIGFKWNPWSSAVQPSAEDCAHCCRVVISFFHVVFGFVVPSALLYCSECYTRLRFAMSRGLARFDSRSCERIWRKTVFVVSGLSCISIMMFWVALKDLEWLTHSFGC